MADRSRRDCLDNPDCGGLLQKVNCFGKGDGREPASGLLQLNACLLLRFTEKRRNLRVTLCEGLSHLLIVVILFLGYRVSKIKMVDQGDYSSLKLSVPPPFLKQTVFTPTTPVAEALQRSVNIIGLLSTLSSLLEGPIVVPDLQQYLTATSYIAPIYARLDRTTRSLVQSTNTGNTLANILNRGVMHFAPRSPQVTSLIGYLNRTTPLINSLKVYQHSSESAAIDFILANPDQRTFALVVVRGLSAQKVNYVIRMNYTTLPNTNLMAARTSLGLSTLYQKYLLSGFMSLQKTVDSWAFNATGAASSSASSPLCRSKPDPFMMPFPTAAFALNPFYSQVGFLLGLGLTMATLYPVSRTVSKIVEEKETRMREIMKIMGLRDWAHQLSWFLTAFILFFWIALSTTYICTSSFLRSSNSVLIFAYFFLFTLSEVTFCLFLSVFFSNSKLASIAAPVLLFVTILPRYVFFSTNNDELYVQKYAASLLSPTAFTFGADIIATAEAAKIGVQWDNMWEDSYSFGGCLSLMLFDFFLYGLLAWYLDQVLPSEFGTPKHPLFFFEYKYWCPAKGAKDYRPLGDEPISDLPEFQFRSVVPGALAGSSTLSLSEGAASLSTTAASGIVVSPDTPRVNFEPLDEDQIGKAAVRLSKLRKQYPDGKVAVKSVSMALLEGQITCLLGANGAGKTSLISILTGMFEATSGEVSIYGRSLSTDLQTIRQMTGICPQHNVLMGCLTVCEHLSLFGNIKGMWGTTLSKAIDATLAEVGLTEKKHALSSSLSGGMKRKLSLSIALLGSNKFILLDEPTSGMDPYSRRSTWEMLQRAKEGRVIVLTTHFMDEADTLGDRIMIMSEGRLRCSGSSLFLKNRFGAGYVLSMAKTSADCEPGEVERAIRGIVPQAIMSSSVAGELVFNLPLAAVGSFATLFQTLKDRASALGIGSYGVSITTLEQVFIRLAKEADAAWDAQEDADETDPGRAVKAWQWLTRSVSGLIHSFGSVARNDSGEGPQGVRIQMPLTKVSPEKPQPQFRALSSHDPDAGHREGEDEGEGEAKDGEEKDGEGRFDIRVGSSDSVEKDTGRDAAGQDFVPRLRPTEALKPLVINTVLRLPLDDADIAADLDAVVRESVFLFDEISQPGGNFSTSLPLPSSRPASLPHSLPITMPVVLTPAAAVKARSPLGYDKIGDSPTAFAFSAPPESRTVKTVLHLAMDDEGDEEGGDLQEVALAVPAGDDSKASASLPLEEPVLEYSLPLEHKATSESSSLLHRLQQNIVVVQLTELLRKRAIIASRDLKGFFFQIVLPTAQIVLVLAVLTVSFSPAGRTIRLLAPMYRDRSGVAANAVVGGVQRGAFLYNALSCTSTSALRLLQINTMRSSTMSARLLSLQGAKSTRSKTRYGAYQYNDSVAVDVTVTWSWVKANLPFILQNAALIDSVAGLFGYPLNLNEPLLRNLNTSLALPANFNLTSFLRATNVNAAANAQQANASLALAQAASVFDANQQASGGRVSVRAKTVTYDPAAGTATLSGLSFTIGNATRLLGNVSLPASAVAATLLPTGVSRIVRYLPTAFSLMHNSSSPHAMAIFNGELMANAFATCSPASSSSSGASSSRLPSYIVKNHPLPLTVQQTLEIKVILALFASLFILIPLCYIPAAFVAFTVKERASKSLHLQLVSGVSPQLYWIATYMWDSSLYFILTSAVMAAFFCYGRSAAAVFISTTEASTCVFLLVWLYGQACLPLCYLYSLAFDNSSVAQISIMTWNFVTGFVAVLAYFIMRTIPETRDAAAEVVHFFRFFPPYLVGEGLVNLSAAFFLNLIARRPTSYYEWEVAGRPIIFLACETVGYFSLVLLSESKRAKRLFHWIDRKFALLGSRPPASKTPVDADVQEEADRVADADPADFALLIRGLTKVYPPTLMLGASKHAVRGVSFACSPGERFGLLGINGAGKTTTLGILTSDIQATDGEVYVCGRPLSDPEAQNLIGYCPQVDPLLDLLNSYETLWFFGRIRGIPEAALRVRVDELIKQVGLVKHAARPCGTYSGGNKRKLSLALALIGDPRVLLLDEPSTGMDPEARRAMWSVIEQVSGSRSIILVSHSMEECEALCTRMGIMVSGRLQCLGSAQHIKGKFGASYQLECRCHDSQLDGVLTLLQDTLPGAVVEERHAGFLRLTLDHTVDLAVAFDTLERNKERLQILDYSISQATLEQVFIDFASKQDEERGQVRGMTGQPSPSPAPAPGEGDEGGTARAASPLEPPL